MLTTLSTRFQDIREIRRDERLLVARALHEGRHVLLSHGVADAGTAQVVQQRLLANGGTARHWGELVEHGGGATWVSEDDGGWFLDEWLDLRSPLEMTAGLQVLLDLALALDMLHRCQIVHLGLRPACVRVGERDGVPQARLLLTQALPLEAAAGAREMRALDDARYSAPELGGRGAGAPDARSDLYLLGLLAYQLLGGGLPFEAEDVLGWLHAHAAQTPAPLRALRPEVPEPVERLVQSLLAKSPHQRPASARLVADDLRRCLEQTGWGRGAAAALPLRSQTGRFEAPRQLIGRRQERQVLTQAVQRIQGGATEILTLYGVSGAGKTALARDLRANGETSGMVCVAGKFDMLAANRPYAVLGKVIDDLVRASVGSADTTQAPDWAQTLGAAGATLAAFSPELARRLGTVPALADIPPGQARQRLLTAMLAFLGAVSQRCRGLVLFLDDVQWADDETMALLAGVLADRSVRGVLLLLGWRTEAEGEQPRVPARWGWESAVPQHLLEVHPMRVDEVQAWLAAALHGGQVRADIAEWLHRISGGNPFFLGQLVGTLVQQGRLLPDVGGRWQLDADSGRGIELPASAIAAAERRLHSLSPAVVELLGLAATLGAQFEAQDLRQVTPEPTRHEMENCLRQAQAAGLVEPGLIEGLWQFTHDRLQQAAYESVDSAARLQRHLHVGRALRAGPRAGALRFEICHHLNRVTAQLDDGERQTLALLNQQAAQDARVNAAFSQCALLMRAALAALPATHGLSPARQLALLHDAAEAALLERSFASAEECLDRARQLASTDLEVARNDELRIHWLIAQNRAREALDLGVAALRRLGLNVSERTARRDALWQFVRFKLAARKFPVEGLMRAPENRDPRHVQTQRLIFASINIAHTLTSPLYPVLGLLGTRLTLQGGLTPWSWLPISAAGHMLAAVFHDIDLGYRLGDLSVRLGQRLGTHSLSFNHLFYTMHWKVPLAQTLPLLIQCYEQAERAGNFEIATYAVSMYVGVSRNTMTSLAILDEAIRDGQAFAERRGSEFTRDCCELYLWAQRQMRQLPPGGVVRPYARQRPDGRVLPHDALLQFVATQVIVGFNVIYRNFGDDVVAYGEAVRKNLRRMAGNFSMVVVHWYDALLHAERLQGGQPARGSARLLRQHYKKMRHWSSHCPANHGHRVASLAAELAVLAGQHEQAAQAYASGVAQAVSNGFTGDAALIAERAARWHRRAGREAQARGLFEQAYSLYAKWGATGKLQQLQADLPRFAAARAPGNPAADFALDAQTLIKAAQAITGELDQSCVAEQLLRNVMENTGARYAALVLTQNEEWLLSAQRAEADVAQEQGGLVAQTRLPLNVLRFVVQTHDSVVLEDGNAGHDYGFCARWQGKEAVSVLCVPVLTSGQCVGALYLENDLMRGCFTPQRVALVGVLAAQAAIAISNSRLFAEVDAARENLRQANLQLEQRVAERTCELQDNYQRLARLERQHAADEERQRIMRDLHDGLGSQLFVTLSRAERGEITNERIVQALRDCIADMRLALEAMSPDGADFLEVWGNFRYRWQGQLDAARLAVNWQDEVPADGVALSPHVSLQLLRIVQEALTNVLKHARARQVEVRLSVQAGVLRVEVVDDGVGLGTAAASGRGLGNMHARAARLGAQVHVGAAAPGTRVAISCPLPSDGRQERAGSS